jgi:hypothetical protein
MKQPSDKFTSEIFGNRPGRPRKVDAKSGAQRTREHRAKKAAAINVTVTSNFNCTWCGADRAACCGICNIGQLGHKD